MVRRRVLTVLALAAVLTVWWGIVRTAVGMLVFAVYFERGPYEESKRVYDVLSVILMVAGAWFCVRFMQIWQKTTIHPLKPPEQREN